ncbi:MAG: PKD domain-containing protein [Bacteroidetes bacterium]|nr:PKD domain-containing protein [Bacteroidota bacterium]
MKKHILLFGISILLFSCGKKPTADFTWSPQNPKAGQEMQFTNQSTDAKKYDWNLGNMKISSEANPKNTYDNAGNYIIDLTARNGMKSNTKTVTITVVP